MGKSIAFLGLGVMGYPMAGWLSRNGYQVTVYNRTTSVAERWVTEYSGQHALTPDTAVQNAEIVFLCLGNDQDVEEVILTEQGILVDYKVRRYCGRPYHYVSHLG